MHRHLLHCIADVGREDLVVELKTALAVSLSYDGSVDAYQEDSKYLGVRYVTRDGVVKAKFLGTEAPTECGAQGAVGAIRKVLDKFMWPFSEATSVITGFTADGESLNTGSKTVYGFNCNNCVQKMLCAYGVLVTAPVLPIRVCLLKWLRFAHCCRIVAVWPRSLEHLALEHWN